MDSHPTREPLHHAAQGQSRRRWLAALIVFLLATPAAAGEGRITLLHFNDFYEIAPIEGWGGFAPLETLLERERARNPASLTLLSGDFISPSLLSGTTRGAHMIEFGNAIGIDIAVPGNHEFDFGAEVFRKRMGESRFPWLVTNLREADGRPFNGAPETLVRTVDGVRIGFLGLLTPQTKVLASGAETLRLEPVQPAAVAAVAALRAEGAEVIVALTHLSFEEDRDLAHSVSGIDLILGGHDHAPMTFMAGHTLVHKSGQDGHWLGVVELLVERDAADGVRVTPSWRMESTRGVAGDAEIAARVATFEKTVDEAMGQAIGSSSSPLDSRAGTVRFKESSFGDLAADALRAGLAADVAVINGGGIRGDRLRPAGQPLTRRDVMTELPFANLALLFEVRGAAIREFLETAMETAGQPSGDFPQVSGLALVYDVSRPAGSRLVEVTVGGRPLDDAALYRFATSDYLAFGAMGTKVLAGAAPLVDRSAARLLTTLVEEYLAARSPVDLGSAPRIRATGP